MPNLAARRPARASAQTVISSRLAAVEAAQGLAVAFGHTYPESSHIAEHQHSRSQLMFPASGALAVHTRSGHWLVPADHVLWIPAGMRHSVDLIGEVTTHSVYVRPDAIEGLPTHLHVGALTPLLRHLVFEAETFAHAPGGAREGHIIAAILHEILRLPGLPLGLPMPASPRLNEMCRDFIAAPGARLKIDDWAEAAGMSRRTFTRTFRAETGLSLSTWRQQALLIAALPRLSAGEPVTAVAIDLGYDSVPAFTTMFSRMLGAPPRAYFRALRG
jgi:AraC-type DNA-binding domain-containing proteins